MASPIGRPPRKSEQAKLNCETKAIGITAAAIDTKKILL